MARYPVDWNSAAWRGAAATKVTGAGIGNPDTSGCFGVGLETEN